MDSSAPAVEGWKAQLISETVLDTNEGCIEFWYHMYGSVSKTFKFNKNYFSINSFKCF